MNNKLLHNIAGVITFFSLTGIAIAEPANSDVNPLENKQFNEQMNETETHIPSEYILSEMYTVVSSNSTSGHQEKVHPVQNRKNTRTETSDNFEWVPEDWYSAY